MTPDEGNQIIVNARFLTQPITGVQRFAIEISRLLKVLIPNIKFVAPPAIQQQDIALELQVETFGKLSSHFWEQLELPLYLQKLNNPLLINLCNTAPIFYRNKLVCIHDLASFINPKWFSKSFATVYKLIIPRIAKSSKRILTVSNFSKASIHAILKIPLNNIEVIYNAVSPSFVGNTLEKGKNKHGRYILAVSSIEPRKNIKNLITGFSLAKIPGVKLVIVGAGSKVFNNPDFTNLIQDRDDIVFTGHLPDNELVTMYKNAIMFVYPSLFEGFGIPPLEAMHCGCPTIVSANSSLPEVCGDASLYVNPLQVEEISEAMKVLMVNTELREKLILKGYARARGFNWKNSAEKLAELINNLK